MHYRYRGLKIFTPLRSVSKIFSERQDGVITLFPEELDDGRAVILNFIFTSCAAICPMSSRVLSGVQNKLGNEIQDVHMVSISIDPEYDNIARINEYAEKFKAKPQWQFYTGTVDNIKALQIAFKVENGFQYLPPKSVEFPSQKICMCHNINMIVGIYWKI